MGPHTCRAGKMMQFSYKISKNDSWYLWNDWVLLHKTFPWNHSSSGMKPGSTCCSISSQKGGFPVPPWGKQRTMWFLKDSVSFAEMKKAFFWNRAREWPNKKNKWLYLWKIMNNKKSAIIWRNSRSHRTHDQHVDGKHTMM